MNASRSRHDSREPWSWLALALVFLLAQVAGVPAQASESVEEQASCYDEARVGPLITLDAGGALTAVVAPNLGGQLVGLTYRDSHGPEQLLYRGMDFCEHQGWGGKAPILWPATGRNINSAVPGGLGWRWSERDYTMPIHGFARDLPWNVIDHERGQSSATLRLELRQTAQTRVHYPFDFAIRVEFRLDETGLTIAHEVVAAPENPQSMPFSIGNHITFRQPLSPGGSMTVTSPATRRLVLDTAGRPVAAEAMPPLLDLPLSTFADEVAVPLSGYTGRPWLEIADSGGMRIRLEQFASSVADDGTVMFNLWGSSLHGFISPEPWFGRQNSLVDDVGLVRLLPGDTFTWQLHIRVSR